MPALFGDQDGEGRQEGRLGEKRGQIPVAGEEASLGLEGPGVKLAAAPRLGTGRGRRRRRAPAEVGDQRANPLLVDPRLARQRGGLIHRPGRRQAPRQALVDAGQLALEPEGLGEALEQEEAAVGRERGEIEIEQAPSPLLVLDGGLRLLGHLRRDRGHPVVGLGVGRGLLHDLLDGGPAGLEAAVGAEVTTSKHLHGDLLPQGCVWSRPRRASIFTFTP